MKPLILESHFTGTSNLDTVMEQIDTPVLRLRAFDTEKSASFICSHRFRVIDSNVFRARHYGGADIIIGAPPIHLYTCRCSGAVKGLSLEWLASLRRVRQVMPRFVFYECTVHAPWDRVRARLSQWGYVCALATVSARDVGAPHRHKRTYLLGCLEPLNVKQPFYKRNPYTLIPSPTPTMNRSPLTDKQRTKSNFQTWLSKYGDEPSDAFEHWSAIMGHEAPNSNDFIKKKERVAEWMMGIPYGWVSNQNLSHATACLLIGSASVWQQAHLGLWRASLEVNRLLA
jgi:site-specific DNA-cytosine methylase